MPAETYSTGKPCARGHLAPRYLKSGVCTECNRENAAAWRKQHPERARATVQAAWAKFKEKYRIGHNTANRRWRREHPDEAAAIRQRNYAKTGLAYFRAARSRRRATEFKRTPRWADIPTINRIYADCPPGHHVDHVFPLRGRLVSGLHVEANLQYLPASENQRKHNLFVP